MPGAILERVVRVDHAVRDVYPEPAERVHESDEASQVDQHHAVQSDADEFLNGAGDGR